MNQQEAIAFMKQGGTVRGINGLFLTHAEHGGIYLYRWSNGNIERFKQGGWIKSKGSFALHTNFDRHLDDSAT